ncbi:MAG: monovalent cation/H(+) antiporter subunit G [Rhodocyclaceae bacterium]|nr:monovalent cation/H(+) antiporter subunit G [Rhodocyclaceae bacterium]
MIVLDILTWLLVSAGGVFCVIGAVGMLRMPDFFTRMHAASVIDTLGAGLIIVGLILQSGFTLASLKLIILGLLIFFTSPTASHALANAALARGAEPLLADDEGEPSSSPR